MGDGFKHITVTAAQEDDEVIVAGAVGAPGRAAGPGPGPAPEEEGASPASPASGRTRDDGFHETTLDDLEGGKMPLAQAIVIVAAIVCIIGALVYYFVAMR